MADGTAGKWSDRGRTFRAVLFVISYQIAALVAVFATSIASAGSSAQSQPSLSGIAADTVNAISGNPGAVNVKPGIGLLGRTLGFGPDSGVFLGGLWSGDADYLIGGGNDPKTWSLNSLALIGLDLDFQKLAGIPGGELGATFLPGRRSSYGLRWFDWSAAA